MPLTAIHGSCLGRLREACGGDPAKLAGIVEADETFVGRQNAKVTSKATRPRDQQYAAEALGTDELLGYATSPPLLARADVGANEHHVNPKRSASTEAWHKAWRSLHRKYRQFHRKENAEPTNSSLGNVYPDDVYSTTPSRKPEGARKNAIKVQRHRRGLGSGSP